MGTRSPSCAVGPAVSLSAPAPPSPILPALPHCLPDAVAGPSPVGSPQSTVPPLEVTLLSLFDHRPQPAVKLLYNRSNNKYSYTR